MMNESRVKKTLLNARVNLIFYFITLTLSFFSRKIVLNTLGADFVGLTSTLTNLLSFLNLAELGIGTAIGYVLYKPLFEQNQDKINEIISVFGYLYQWVGKIILISGCILSLFLPLIFQSSGFDLSIIYLAYWLFHQLSTNTIRSRPEKLRYNSLFSNRKYYQDSYPNEFCLLYRKLLHLDCN